MALFPFFRKKPSGEFKCTHCEYEEPFSRREIRLFGKGKHPRTGLPPTKSMPCLPYWLYDSPGLYV